MRMYFLAGFMLVFAVFEITPSAWDQTAKAEEANRSASLMPMQAGVLRGSKLVWDAEMKSTNVASGLDFARFCFAFTNVSALPLTISNVQTSCGCTKAQLPPLPWVAPPGSNGQFGVSVDLAGKAGRLFKTITVITSQGTKKLMVKVAIQPPHSTVMAEEVRMQNFRVAQRNRQAVFQGDCASCHVKSVEGKYGKVLYDAVCGIRHEGEHRSTMVPDLHKLTVPTDENFWRTWISYGRPGSLMPAFAKTENGPLTDMQILSLAAYLNMAIPTRATTNSF